MKMQSPSASRFQPVVPDGFAQPNDPQAGTEALLGMRAIFQDGGHSLPAIWPDGFGPVHHAPRRPLQVFLMRLGAMLLQGCEAAWLIISHMDGHALGGLEKFHRVRGHAHIHLLMDQGIGNAVEVVFHRHMVVDIDQTANSKGTGGRGQWMPAISARWRQSPTVLVGSPQRRAIFRIDNRF